MAHAKSKHRGVKAGCFWALFYIMILHSILIAHVLTYALIYALKFTTLYHC